MPKPPPKPPAKSKRKPPVKPKRAAITRRRQALAKAVLAGESVTAVAKREGVSRSHLSRDLNSPETGLIIQHLLGRHRRQMVRLVGKSLKAIDESFKAFRYGIDRDGDPVDLGPDHYARLKAAEKTMDLVKLAQPADGVADTGMFTWEAFLALWRRTQEPAK